MRLSYMIDMDKSSSWMMVTAGEPTRANLPYVQELGDFIAHGKYYTTREGLSSYLIKYTLSGEGVLEYGGATETVPAGHFFWIDCEKAQHYRTSRSDGDWRMLWVHFQGATCRYYYEQFLAANGGRNTAELPAESSVPSNICALMEIYREKSNYASDIRAASILSSILSECIVSALKKGEGVAGQYVREARNYMLLHYAQKITLDELARHLSLNKYYLQKLYRKQTGQTPAEYLACQRLNHAKELLRATDAPIKLIAEQVGVENVSHFIKMFRRSEGTTPNVYRRHWQAQ